MEIDEETDAITSLPAGRIASAFYLKHATMAVWSKGLAAHMSPDQVSVAHSRAFARSQQRPH